MFDSDTQIIVALNVALFVQLIGVAAGLLTDPYVSRANKIRLYGIVGLASLAIIVSQLKVSFDDVLMQNEDVVLRTGLSLSDYIINTLILYLIIRLIGYNKGIKVLNTIIIVNALVCITPFFAPWVFYFNDDGGWVRGPLIVVPYSVSLILLIWLVVSALLKFRGIKRVEGAIPIGISIFILISVLIDFSLGFAPRISFCNVAVTEGVVFFYIWLHMRFVREHENALKAEQRIKIMMSQIQPHFMFNTLSTIQALIEIDPEKASEVTEEFAIYLRQNIHSLEQESMIPVQKELEHTKIYSDIEKVRFPSITIEYIIDDDDFFVPQLTIQPMVENAIRHGVRGKKEGHVSVHTYIEEDYHVVEISDNGKGFDVGEMLEKTAKGDHIGVKNVRDRVIDMANGLFSMTSNVGEGTTIKIMIPKEE